MKLTFKYEEKIQISARQLVQLVILNENKVLQDLIRNWFSD